MPSLRARGHGRGGFPLEELPAARDQAGERDRDRIEHVPRLVPEERQLHAAEQHGRVEVSRVEGAREGYLLVAIKHQVEEELRQPAAVRWLAAQHDRPELGMAASVDERPGQELHQRPPLLELEDPLVAGEQRHGQASWVKRMRGMRALRHR